MNIDLVTRVCEILDFPPTHASTAIFEAVEKGKLAGTFMRVNGKVTYVKGFNWELNLVKGKDGVGKEVETLDVFLPEPGLYTDGVTCVHLTKNSKKNWKKSFNFEQFNCVYISGAIEVTNSTTTFASFLGTAKLVPFFINPKNGAVMYQQDTVGKLGEDGIITMSKPIYYQEVLDWVTKEKLPWTVQ